MTNPWHRVCAALFVLLVLTPAFSARKPRPMYKPAPIGYAERLDPDQVATAVRQALAGRGWGIETEGIKEENPNVLIFRARLLVRVHTVIIDIAIDREQRTITFSYVYSIKMGYRKKKRGEELIHPKYGQWLRNLEQDVRVKLTAIR